MATCRLLVLLLICVSTGLPAQQNGGDGSRTLELSLRDAIKLALRNNLELRAALVDERITRTRIQEALGTFDPVAFTDFTGSKNESLFAAQFPSDPTDPLSPTVTSIISNRNDRLDTTLGVRGVLDTGFSYQLSFTTNYFFDQQGSSFNPILTTRTDLTFTQPILRGAWQAYNLAPVELARIDTMTAHQTWRGQVRQKLKEVQDAYYDLVFSREDLEVKRKSLELADRQIEITRVKVRTGALPKVEITTAESERAQRYADLVTAEAAVVTAEDTLRRLILSFERESDWETNILPTETATESYVTLKDVDEIIRMAELAEPDVLMAHLAVAQAEVAVTQRESEVLPVFDIKGSVGVTGLEDDFFNSLNLGYEGQGAFSWSLGFSFEYPLGNRAADARIHAARLTLKKARINLQNARTELAFQVRQALRDVEVARRTIVARKEATRLGEEQLKNERLRLNLRTSTNLDVFQVEEQLSQRRTLEIRALLDYRLALLDLVRVTTLPLELLIVSEEEKESGSEGVR